MWQLSNFSKDFYVPSVGPDSYRDEPAQFPIGTDRHRCLSPTRLPPDSYGGRQLGIFKFNALRFYVLR
jgi:hypothetical protein